MKKTLILMVSCNGRDITDKNIKLLRTAFKDEALSIIAIDNASTDGTADYLKEQEDVTLILNDEDLGFPLACDQGIKCAYEMGLSGYDIFILKNENVLTEDMLSAIKHSVENDGNAENQGPPESEGEVRFLVTEDYLEYMEASKRLTDEIPYGAEDEFNMLIVGCGLGKGMHDIESAYPKARVLGIETNKSLFDYASKTEAVSESVEALGQMLTDPVFDILYVSERELKKLSVEDIEVISRICAPNCLMLK